ncbi:MAG: hypothetical protein [Bacteriophage sp.]|nr:MAG: hypothetical protein [Bacteriophage sp.]
MKRYIIISYDGSNLNPSEVISIASQLKVVKPDIENVHASTMDEKEVSSIVIRHAENKNATELSVVESACIYAKEKFGKFFNSKIKLMFALIEAVNDEPNNESLTNAIKVISCGVSKRMRDSYGISTDVICVFKTVQDNM